MTIEIGSRPIFIGGDGRSGTTLLSVVLDSHPDLSIGPELHFKGPPNLGPYLLAGLEVARSRGRAIDQKAPEWRSFERFTTRAARFGVPIEVLEGMIRHAMARTGTDLEAFEERCCLIEAMGQHVAREAGKPIWGMKIMREIKGLPRYARVWPQARFVHIIRDGRDVAASQTRDHSSWGYKDLREAAQKWSKTLARVARFRNRFKLLEIRYEDLVYDTLSTLQSVASFLEIPWDQRLMEHEKASHALFDHGKTHPSFRAVRRSINDSAVGRYRRDLDQEEIRTFEDEAGETLRSYGYLKPGESHDPPAPTQSRIEVESSRSEVTANLATETTGGGSVSVAPIFLGGDGRSGTTLLSLILDSHPDVLGIPELHFQIPDDLGPSILHILSEIESSDLGDKDLRFRQEDALRKPFQFYARCLRAGLGEEVLGQLVREAMSDCDSDLSTYSDRCVLVDRICSSLLRDSGKRVWCLKVMKQLRRIPELGEFWQGARYVHIVRDGRDVAASQIKKFAWGYDSIDKAAAGWQLFVKQLKSFADRDDVFELRYEDLVMKPAGSLKALLQFLGLKWNPAVLSHHEVEHGLQASNVSHASGEETARAIHQEAVGKYWLGFTRPEVAQFNQQAAEALAMWGYDTLPVIEIDLQLGAGDCQKSLQCRRYVHRVNDRLVPRYITLEHPHGKQVKAAFMVLGELDYEAFSKSLKKIYKGKRLYNAKRAVKEGYYCKPFHRSLFLPDIVEINQSKEVRSGGPMREAYLKPLEKMGGPPKTYLEFEKPQCPVHYDWWWGVFQDSPGYQQGKVVTDEKLVGYVDFRRNGNFAMYNLIIGHGDHLQSGIMYLLHLEIIRWVLAREDPHVKGLEYIGYAGFFQGGDGLRRWKKSMGFAPVYMAMVDGREAAGS